MKNDWTYVALCLVAPLAWGVLSARLFDWWQARRRSKRPPALAENESVDMYHI